VKLEILQSKSPEREFVRGEGERIIFFVSINLPRDVFQSLVTQVEHCWLTSIRRFLFQWKVLFPLIDKVDLVPFNENRVVNVFW